MLTYDEPKPLLILGTGLFAQEVADLAADTPGLTVAGFVENLDSQRCAETLNGFRIFWIDEISDMAGSHKAICSLGTTHRDRFVQQVASTGMAFATLVHPDARLSATSSLGEGSLISAGVIVASHTKIATHVRLNRGALVGHHTDIADYVTVQPGANIAGACHIGEGAYIGMGAIVQDRTTVGAHSVVGSGAVVTKDVPENVQVVGVPARIVKQNIEGL